MPKLAALASAADNICFASSSVTVSHVRGMSPHLNMHRIFKRPFLWPRAISRLHSVSNFQVVELTDCDSLGSLPVSRDAGIFQQLNNTKFPVRARKFGPPFRIT